MKCGGTKQHTFPLWCLAGAPVKFQSSTLIFNLDSRPTGEGTSAPLAAGSGTKSFIEEVITNRTRNSNKLRDTEKERAENEGEGQTSLVQRVISNRLHGDAEKVDAGTERTERPNPSELGNPDLLDFTAVFQKLMRELRRNEASMDKLNSPTEEPKTGTSFIQQVLSNRERDEESATEEPRKSYPPSYVQEILKGRGLGGPVGTGIPTQESTAKSVTIPAGEKGGVIQAEPTHASSERGKVATRGDPTLAAERSQTRLQNEPLRSEGGVSKRPGALPLETPPEKTRDTVRDKEPPQLTFRAAKPFYEQVASSGVTYETWRQQRLSDMCGRGWQEDYQQLHEEILSGRREPRYLVYSCPGYRQGCCGYGNRLRALASVFYLAVLTGRAFIIDWLLPEPIDRHLLPKGIRWNDTEPIDMCSGPEFRRHYWGSTKSEIRQAQGWILQDSSSFARWFTGTNLSAFFEYPVERITTIWYFVEQGVRENPFLMARATELRITPLLSRLPPYALIACAFDFLFTISERVELQLSRLRKNFGQRPAGPTIGIHVRTGDDQFDYYASENDRTWNARNVSRLLRFFECAANVEKTVFGLTTAKASAVKWFVATDNLKVKTTARQLFPAKVVTSDLPILHLDILVNSTLSNVTVDCHYSDSTNTTLVCTDVEPFNRTVYCANRTNLTMSNMTVFNATEGIVSMLVDHFLLAESDFLVLSDSSFGSAAVGLSMRGSESYTFGDRSCADIKLAQRQKKLQFFKRWQRVWLTDARLCIEPHKVLFSWD